MEKEQHSRAVPEVTGAIAAVMIHVADPAEALNWYEQAFAGAARRLLPGSDFEYLDYGGVMLELVPADAKVASGAAGSVVYWQGPGVAAPIFPVGGIRARAYRLSEYALADSSEPSDAFVHLRLQIGAGRSEEVKKEAGDALFAVLTDHFAEEFARRGLMLSAEIGEFSEAGTWKKNNIHARYRK
ncbi:5-carboxymethyl-2-hydroxymuconate Delta-isomerase [Deinococcus wulumuqiensis]|uniref:5-carboxymethyl-2-hydroxymuconate Delta-isomerase n=1 Tax=Deinococcus wulumuqiensis TaxID=980427 RepID=UPI0004B1B2BD|nr:5-carboxymethyl-2-hydroxymuconate Delta-isomerase [Deinococcus wulumuqiensis]